jgi:hypothetical protein
MELKTSHMQLRTGGEGLSLVSIVEGKNHGGHVAESAKEPLLMHQIFEPSSTLGFKFQLLVRKERIAI